MSSLPLRKGLPAYRSNPLHFFLRFFGTYGTSGLLRDYIEATSTNSTSRPIDEPTLARTRWKPPQVYYFKINTDGAFDPISKVAVVGVVVCDACSTVLGGLARPLADCTDAASAEAQAAIAEILFGCDHGWSKMVIETDSAIVAHKINRHCNDLYILSPFIECSQLLLVDADDFSVCFIPREMNSIAYSIASRALHLMSSISFDLDYLVYLRIVVTNEIPSHHN
ncbi:hypothetical protein V6N12_007796 [Hibiscus sabdariffa]|uniref:RNase H type-1 domain-containing protein n=1 Tax=Hibiscus sabdariffa TaxID=183260 RepID=A0ABR2F2S5_9ROSI